VTAYEKPLTNFNAYVYALNNPYRFTDPDGRDSASCYSNGGCGGNNSFYASREKLGAIADFLPIVSAIKGIAEAAQNPTPFTIAIAVVGAIPEVGGVAKTALRTGEHVASSAVQGLKLEKSLASEAQTATVMAGEGEAIAGAGTKTELRDAPRLASQYGGNSADWAKVSGGNHVAQDGTKIETHAYQNTKTGQVVEPKTKLRDEGQ
jgi:hypothetical protein